MVRTHMTKVYTKSPPLSRTGRGCSVFRTEILLFLLLTCLLAAGCGAAEPPKPTLEAEDPALVLWPKAEKAVTLKVRATRDLNMFDSKAHSIQVCVYQLASGDAFLELAKTPEGIAKLLQATAFDDSVKSVMRFFVQPFEEVFLQLDRAANATFIGVVSGFFDATPENSAKLWEIKPKETTSGMLFWKSTIYSAGSIELSLRLGDHAMQEAQAENQATTGGTQ